MNEFEIIARLKPIVANYVADKALPDQITEETDFIKDLKINSANLVDIVLDVEEEFDIEIDNLEMARMLNVTATLEIIEAKLKALDR